MAVHYTCPNYPHYRKELYNAPKNIGPIYQHCPNHGGPCKWHPGDLSAKKEKN